ncbi:hypothetical protein WS68_14400 [Burkholderia sp. TSV86]|nr:hypothetical protein WS68_14400 [Burkholderia sp. TSV86]
MPSRRCKQPLSAVDASAGLTDGQHPRGAGGRLLGGSETTAERRNSIGGYIAIRWPGASTSSVFI